MAHPPCQRWGRYAEGGPSAPKTRKVGDDGGCFAAALQAVRSWGGVLEHPEASHAWRWFGLVPPPRHGGWYPADLWGGWTCCVEQGHYGHRARKATWLYVHGVKAADLPELTWGPCSRRDTVRLDQGFHSAEERRAAGRNGRDQTFRQMGARERVLTPIPFAELILDIARRTGR